MDNLTRNPIDFKKALQLWREWCLVRISLGTARKQETMHPLCTCASPNLYWDESPSHPDYYDIEHCHKCSNYTYWQRTKNENFFPDWRLEQDILTGEVRFRSESKGLLLTEEEYANHSNFEQGKMSDDVLQSICLGIAQKFDIPTAKKLIQRTFQYMPEISKSRPNCRKREIIIGTIFNKKKEVINF